MTAPATATLTEVTRRFGPTVALRDVDLVMPAGRVIGLLGRNGAGKSTLLSLLAGRRRPTGGEVLVDGGDPFEDPATVASTCLVGDGGGDTDTDRLSRRLDLVARLRPNFERTVATELLDDFEVDSHKRISKLSRGQRAAAAVTIGLASRCPLTLFDESHLGMDPHNRYRFYDALVSELTRHPRTIVISTHHVDEVARLLEEVVILEQGRVHVHDQVDDLRSRSVALTGPTAQVDDLLGTVKPLRVRRFGHTTQAVVFGDDAADLAKQAASTGVDTSPVGLQDLFVHLTDKDAA